MQREACNPRLYLVTFVFDFTTIVKDLKFARNYPYSAFHYSFFRLS